MTDPASLDVRPARKGVLQRLSWVWIVPLIALVVSLALAYQSYSERGTLVEIAFDNASGIVAGETKIKFRDVDVGTVEDVSFADGLSVVIISARMDNTIAPYLDDDAQFWVVAPDVSVRGISGLETVLSGVYIEGSWDNEADVAQYEFVGLEEPPLVRSDQRGTAIILRAREGHAMSNGAPILHKGIEVGYLETPQLSNNGQTVLVNAFIEAPYDRLVNSNTRFWDTSGFAVTFGANGLSLDVDSLASLIEGGIAFDTLVSGGTPIRDGQVFNLFDDANSARESLFASDTIDEEQVNLSLLFDGSVNGLVVGADVRFQGISIGEVVDLSAIAVGEGDQARVQMRATIGITPTKLGLSDDATKDEALAFLSDYVRQGLRARLATRSLLSNSLLVQLVDEPDAPYAVMDLSALPFPSLPTTTNDITNVADTAGEVLQRVNDLPVEELIGSAIDLMNSVEAIARDENLRTLPSDLSDLLEEARTLITSDDVQAIAPDLRAVIAEMDTVVSTISEADIATQINDLITRVDGLAANLEAGTENLPQITAQVEELLTTANSLNLKGLVDQGATALEQVSTFIASDAVTALPDDLNATLNAAKAALADAQAWIAGDDTQAIPADVRALLADLDALVTETQDAGVVTKLGEAIDSAANAANSFETATADLPEIIDQVTQFTQTANELELDTLVARASDTLESIDTLLGSDSTQDLPRALGNSLDELQAVLQDVREGGAINNVNAALSSANSAAQAIENAATSLPALSRQATALVAETQSLLDTYGDRSRFNNELLQTLRDIQQTAEDISSLSRTIERNPSSIITGR